MYIDLKKTLEEISRCLPEKGVPTSKQLQRMYELTLRLQSQELAVIYDMEAFGSPAAQEQRPLAQQHSGGENRNGVVTLKIGEPLPAMKKLTETVEEHWKAMLHAAISDAAAQGPLPYFEKAFVEIEIVTPRGSNNARVWDTSNRALQVILNNLKGIFFMTTTWSTWPFQWPDGGAKKALRSSVFWTASKSTQIRGIRSWMKNRRNHEL